jgi:hypothetical protein
MPRKMGKLTVNGKLHRIEDFYLVPALNRGFSKSLRTIAVEVSGEDRKFHGYLGFAHVSKPQSQRRSTCVVIVYLNWRLVSEH